MCTFAIIYKFDSRKGQPKQIIIYNKYISMKKHLLCTRIAVALVALCACFSAVASVSRIKTTDMKGGKVLMGKNHQWKSASMITKKSTEQANTEKVTLGPTHDYGFVTAVDGTQWYVTQNYTIKNYYYASSEITLYNSKGEKQGTINVTVPEGKSCNQIMVGETITNNLFDRTTSTQELPVILHIIHSPGVASFVTYVYDIASGELKHTFDGLLSVVKYYNGYAYEAVGVLSYTADENGERVSKYDIYGKPAYGKTALDLKKTFSVPNKLAEYQVGSVLNVFEIENSVYYVLSQYEKEYLDPASYQEPWDMIPTANNNFVATIYNDSFKAVGKVTLPVTSTQQYLVQYGVGLFGYKDLANDFWDESGELRLVVTTTGFEVTTEKEDIQFNLYDTKGNKVKTIAEDVSNWMNMYDIPGEPAQMVFLSGNGAAMSMVNLPSCETVVTFGAEIEGNAISTNIDRCAVGGTYQYVIGLPSPETASNGDIYQRYAWVKKDGTIDRFVKFNLGANNVNWTPLVIGEVLSPYLFDTDSEREYIFIANQRVAPNSTNMIDEVRVMKEDGTLVRAFVEDPNGKGDLGSCSLLGLDGEMPTIFVPYYNSNTDEINIEMEFLPFAMMKAGGEGTKENPYLITSAGDMALMNRNASAHYKVVNNFDAGDYGKWKAVPYFTGTFDGGNYTISNLQLEGEGEYAGIFSVAESAVIKNLVLESPKMYLDREVAEAGFIAGEAVADTIINVHVKGAEVMGNGTNASIGGIVGKAMFNTIVNTSSVDELCVDAQYAIVGGIMGSALTSSMVNASYVTGEMNGGKAVGGIIGSASTGCAVRDCRIDAVLTGDNTIGGVVGEADRGGIFNCYVEASITATGTNMNGYSCVGGVAGSLASDWESDAGADVDSIIAGNVVKLESLTAPTTKGVHRIVGYSRYEDDEVAKKWDSSIVPTHEAALDNNYVMGNVAAINASVAAEANTTEGADMAADALNKAFLESIGYKYGIDVENAWDAWAEGKPRLYFENPETSAVENVAAEKNGVCYDGKAVCATDAVKVELYSMTGVKVASVKGNALQVTSVTAGVYVVVATDANGATETAKIVVK